MCGNLLKCLKSASVTEITDIAKSHNSSWQRTQMRTWPLSVCQRAHNHTHETVPLHTRRCRDTGQISSQWLTHYPPFILSFPAAMFNVLFFFPSAIAESSDFLYVGFVAKGSSCQETNNVPFSDKGLLVVSAKWTEWHFLGTAHTKILCLSHKGGLVRAQVDCRLLLLTDWNTGYTIGLQYTISTIYIIQNYIKYIHI